jgi:SMI1-KNR4 cell-wall
MTESHYNQAVILLQENDIPLIRVDGADQDKIELLETEISVSLPKSYRRLLSQFGLLGFEGNMISGIGKNGVKGDNFGSVCFSTIQLRRNKEITSSMVHIMPSGYGPYFVIDCGQIDQLGEAPVYEINERGYNQGMKKVADSFGEFLLKEVKTALGI